MRGAVIAIQPVTSSYDFSPLFERMQHYVDQQMIHSCCALVMKGQEVVGYRTLGVMDRETGSPCATMQSTASTPTPRSSPRWLP